MDFFLRFLLLLLLSEIFVLLKFLLFKKRAVVFAVLCFSSFFAFFLLKFCVNFELFSVSVLGFPLGCAFAWLSPFCSVIYKLAETYMPKRILCLCDGVLVWVCVCVIIRECAANKKLSATFDSDIVGKCVDIFSYFFFFFSIYVVMKTNSIISIKLVSLLDFVALR